MPTDNALSEPTTMWNKNFICIVLAWFMMCMGHSSVNPLVATYAKYLGASAQLTGFLVGMFFGVSLLLKPFSGPAMMKYDNRKLLIMSFALGAFANIGYALFHSIPAFTVFRVFSGVQYGLVGALIVTLCANYIPKERMAYGIGIYGASGSIGHALAPWFGETILQFGISLRSESLGFTLMFLFGALMFVLGAIPAFLIDPEIKSRETIANTSVWYKNIFSIHVSHSAIMLLLGWLSFSIIQMYAFEFGRQYDISGVSTFFLVLAFTLAISRPLSGYLNDRIGVRKLLFPALFIFAVAMLVIGGSRTLWMMLIGAVLAAAGFGATIPALQAMGMQSEPSAKRGVAGNTMYIGIDSGMFLGPYVGGLIYAHTADYSIMFRIGAIPIVLAMIFFAVVLPIHNRRIKELEAMT